MAESEHARDVRDGATTRRTFLTRSAGAGGALVSASALGSFLSACGSSSSASRKGGGDKMLAVNKNGTLDFATVLPVSGAFTITTVPWHAAMQYAIEEKNAEGGVKVGGKSIKVNSPLLDEGYAAAPALKSVRNFISNGGHFTGGYVSVEGPQAVMGINQRADLMMVVTVSGRDIMLTDNPLRFYAHEIAQAQGPMFADFAYNELGLRRIATIELKNSWGADYQQAFAKTFEQLGGKIVKRDYMLVTDTDFTGIISSWKPLNPDGIYIIIGDGPGTTIGKQLVELGFSDQPLLTVGAWDPNSYKDPGKGWIERAYFSALRPYAHWGDKQQEFASRLYKDHKLFLTNFFWQGYDSTRMVLDAIDLSGSTDPRDVMDALPEAIAKGKSKWLIQSPGAIGTDNKGVYAKCPMWIGKFKPADTDFVHESPLEPVKNQKYQGFPGWLPEQWDGYRVPSDQASDPTLKQLQGMGS